MRKKLTILLSAVMVAGLIPTVVCAGTNTYVNKTITANKGDITTDESVLVIKDNNKDIANSLDEQVFTMELDGAEWLDTMEGIYEGSSEFDVTGIDKIIKVSDAKVTVTIKKDASEEYYRIPLLTQIKDKGDITVSVDGKNSVISSATLTYAVCVSGSATAKIKDTVNISENGAEIKDITITETTAGTLTIGKLKIKLNKNFKFGSINNSNYKHILGDDIVTDIDKIDDNEIELTIGSVSTVATEFNLTGLEIIPDDAKIGSVAEITVSGVGITKTTLEVGTYVDYGTKIDIYDEDEEIPTFYAGKVYDEEDESTLAVIISENVANSINTGRKITFTFPEGVKVTTGYYHPDKGYDYAEGKDGKGIYEKDDSDKDAWDNIDSYEYDIKDNVVTIKNIKLDDDTKKLKMTFAFNLAISPEFTGDVDVVVSGAALDHEETLTIAKVKNGFTVEASVNEVLIDYRNVNTSDIVIKEIEPGVFNDKNVISIAVENVQFEKGMTCKVTQGDMEIEDFNVKDGNIEFTIKDESVKEASEITISNIQLFLDRTLPAGDYDIIIKTAKSDVFDACNLKRKVDTVYFDIDDVTLVKGYIKVVTSGRDKDDSTFTTKITVPIGSYIIKAGEKDIDIDVPAFINADGYTMMPLRAVVEALSDSAIVTWDGETKTATVLFGARVISMTIGQKSMKINGVDVAMLAAPVIVESRTFLPLRDLGYALGLNEEYINWDNITKTATLN